MTEDEAKTKWCPFARIWSEHGPSNRDLFFAQDPNDKANCITSACMAWRSTGPQEQAAWDSPGDGWIRTKQHSYDALPLWTGPSATGYCGLAGRNQ